MSLKPEVILEAKRRVRLASHRGRLLSPRDAWLLSGSTGDSDTLWSIAFKVAMETDASAEELNSFLEAQFPQFTTTHGHTYTWDDFHP
jgi:hypothetical protein